MKTTATINQVVLPINGVELPGVLRIPEQAKGLVIFSHGSGSSHRSPRNNFVAEALEKNGFASLLIDLLTETEDEDYGNRFNITLLTDRLCQVTNWTMHHEQTRDLPIGLFGASTGAASALKASVRLGSDIRAVVSRGGRPDLAMTDLSEVKAPTLLLVGELDQPVIPLNTSAFEQLQCTKVLDFISGATHLFSEPGKLEEVAHRAQDWFDQHLK